MVKGPVYWTLKRYSVPGSKHIHWQVEQRKTFCYWTAWWVSNLGSVSSYLQPLVKDILVVRWWRSPENPDVCDVVKVNREHLVETLSWKTKVHLCHYLPSPAHRQHESVPVSGLMLAVRLHLRETTRISHNVEVGSDPEVQTLYLTEASTRPL